jgi:hypothetical protein
MMRIAFSVLATTSIVFGMLVFREFPAGGGYMLVSAFVFALLATASAIAERRGV